MRPQALYPIINREDYGLAATLEQLLFHSGRSASKEVEIRLGFLSRFVKRSKAALSRYLAWLEREGFIRLRRVYRGTACVLHVRVLVRLRVREDRGEQASEVGHGTAPWNGGDTGVERRGTVYSRDTEEPLKGESGHPPLNGSGAVSPEKLEMALKGSLSDAAQRVTQKQEATRARTRYRAPGPKTLAHEWNRLLRDYAYEPFPLDGKNLRHVGQSIKLFGQKTLEETVAILEQRIARWQDVRPKTLGKAPPHPWAVNRLDAKFKELTFTVPEITQPPEPAPVDEVKPSDNPPPPVIQPWGGSTILELLKKAQAKKASNE